MKHNLKSEMKQSMDALHFSAEDKSAMVQNLLAQNSQEQKAKFSVKKLTVIALAAAIAVMMLTGAAVFTRWSVAAQNQYKPSQQIKEQAEKSGLSVMLEETKSSKNPNEVLSVTDQGITITAVQSIVDKYGAELTFRIEGFDLPEGRFPAAWPIVSIDGDERFEGGQSGEFFDGTTRDEQDNWVYTDGTPIQCDADGSIIYRYVARDGSLEYTHRISFAKTDGRYLGKEIQVKFPWVGIQSVERAGPNEPMVEGDWTLKWTLTGTDSSITVTPNAEIGDSGIFLLEAEIGQRIIHTRYQLKEDGELYLDSENFPHPIRGVRMKDGSQHLCYFITIGMEDMENRLYRIVATYCADYSPGVNVILDPSQVESLMFHKGWEKDANGEPTVETFYLIPVSAN